MPYRTGCPLLALLLLLACTPPPQRAKPFSWHPANTGGGGYITGIVQDPQRAGVLYARCDVAGVFRSTDGGASWQSLNNGLDKWYHHSVQSFAVSAANRRVLFRCSGDKRNNQLFGSIHKSKDGGATWYEVSDRIGYYGNGPTRMYGELIAADPFAPKHVLTAGYQHGIWLSDDEGERWHYRAGKEEKFLCVAINPYHPGHYYAAAAGGRLYHSADRGRTWAVIYAQERGSFTELAFDRNDAAVVYAAGTEGGIRKSTDGGRHFEPVMNGLPTGFGYNTVATDPANTAIVYTAPDARPGHALAPVPVYRSADGGATWALVERHDWGALRHYPSYLNSLPHTGWAISKVRVDVKDSRKLYYANWYGVATSGDGGRQWDAHGFKGLETNCLENIKAGAGGVFYTVADHSPMWSTDGGATYASLPKSPFPSSTAVVQSAADPSVVLYGSRHKGESGIFRVVGDSVTGCGAWGKPSYVQALREDPFEPGVFYAYLDGDLNQHAGLYRSPDGGKSWKKLPLSLPGHVKTLPHQADFIEAELLNIVVGQRKNVVGADKLLCLDPTRPGTLYFGEWTEGIFKSTDGGVTWAPCSKGLPFGANRASVLTVIGADPKRPGHLYAGFIREGLWRSTDSGATWEKVYPKNDAICNVNALHVGGVTGDELYIAGEHLYWSPAPPALRRSRDGGNTWDDLYDPAVGALRIKGIDVDQKTGRIVVASSGNGAFYVEQR